MFLKERIFEAGGGPGDGERFGVYWLRVAHRGVDNEALDYALSLAEERKVPLVAAYLFKIDHLDQNRARRQFMIQGLMETQRDLAERGVPLAWTAVPEGQLASRVLSPLLEGAAFLVTEAAQLRKEREDLEKLVTRSPCPVTEVDCNVLVPVRVASHKEEWSAATLRRKILPALDLFLAPSEDREATRPALSFEYPPSYSRDFSALLPKDSRAWSPEVEDPTGSYGPWFPPQGPRERPGRAAALRRLGAFLEMDLERYDEERNDPLAEATSRLSAYLHFGQVSPAHIVRELLARLGERSASECSHAGGAAYIEQLVVRRELAFNFTHYRDDHEDLSCLPSWAINTLQAAAGDRREAIYGPEDFEAARTHDPYWNAAQEEMRLTGRMSSYMRMYWGKGLLAWSPDPRTAWKTAVALNDRYSLDGLDPNGYAGIAWCFGKHDRPWAGRPVFGSVRYMNARGLKRKFDADAYVRHVAELQRHKGEKNDV